MISNMHPVVSSLHVLAYIQTPANYSGGTLYTSDGSNMATEALAGQSYRKKYCIFLSISK